MTSVDQMEDGRNFSSLGIQGHLVKPARSGLLLQTLIQVMQEARDGGHETRKGVAMARSMASIPVSEEELIVKDKVGSTGQSDMEVENVPDDISDYPARRDQGKSNNHSGARKKDPEDAEGEATNGSLKLADIKAMMDNQSRSSLHQDNDIIEEPSVPQEMDFNSSTVDILVAEDNEVNQIVITQILQATGYTFLIANNGQEAVELYAEHRPRLICMDVSMPIKNGHEATREIREIEKRYKSAYANHRCDCACHKR